MRSPNRTGGFSLVEATVGAAVLALGILASAGAVLSGASLGRENRVSRTSTAVVASLFEEARSVPFGDLETTFGAPRTLPLEGSVSGAVATFEIADAGGTERWPVRRLGVRLAWRSRSGPREARASILVCDRPGTSGGDLR